MAGGGFALAPDARTLLRKVITSGHVAGAM
jgi:hypothetical protein